MLECALPVPRRKFARHTQQVARREPGFDLGVRFLAAFSGSLVLQAESSADIVDYMYKTVLGTLLVYM